MTDQDLISKINDLEARIAFQEDTIVAVNKRIVEQDAEIAKLQFQLKHLNRKLISADDHASYSNATADEPPPHY